MKTSQKGFIAPLLLAIIILFIGGGVYVYLRTKQGTPPIIMTPTIQATSTVQTHVATSTGTFSIPDSLIRCKDFNAFSSDLLTDIGNVSATSTLLTYPVMDIPKADVGFTLPIDMAKHDPETDLLWRWANAAPKSIRWKRGANEPFINYPLTTGIVLYYTEESPFSDKNYFSILVTLINQTLTQDTVGASSDRFGFSPDPLNTYVVGGMVNTLTDNQFEVASRVYGFKKGNDLYSISVNDGKVAAGSNDLRPGEAPFRASIIITCGQPYRPWDYAFDVLKTKISTSTALDNLSYIQILDVSSDDKVYGISSNLAPFNTWAEWFYIINDSAAIQVDQPSWSVLPACETLEKQKVGKGMKCEDIVGKVRKVSY